MSKISWGKNKIKYAVLTNGTAGEYKDFATPKQDTTELTTTAGDETTANEEGGGLVDARFGASSYELAFDQFLKKGDTDPFEGNDNDGVIDGEYAIQVIPEDTDCFGIQIDRCVLRREIAYTAADGITYHYIARALKPASGNMVKAKVIGATAG